MQASSTGVLTAAILAALLACRLPELQQQQPAAASQGAAHSHALNTYYLSVAGVPALELLPAAGSRVPRAAGAAAAPWLRLTLPLASLPAYMPIVSAKKQGLVHQLIRTSAFLQNWAVLDEAVQSLGCKHTTDALFASPGQLLEAASALTPGGNSEAQAAFEAAVASLSCAALGRQCLARAAPASVLLLLPGRRHAGVADIMAVQHAGPGEVALTLALVASPVMVSELEEHAHQSLAHAPHYHFHTPAGMEVDAAAFLDALHELQLAPPELHLFVKGTVDCAIAPMPGQIPDPYNANQWVFMDPRCESLDRGQECMAFCKAGFVGNPTPTIARCTGNFALAVATGNYSLVDTYEYVSGGCVPSCPGNPIAPPNANSFNCPADTPINASCSTTCLPGYTLSGSLTSTCGTPTSNVTWSPVTTAVCSPNPCTGNPASTPANGAWPAGGCNGGSTPNGGSCAAQCASGYNGIPVAICNLGQWGSVSGSCSSTGCTGNPASTPANGAWPAGGCNGGSTPIGGSCIAQCASGYSGSPTAVCTAANWGGINGVCTPTSCVGNPSSTPPNAAWPSSCNGGTTASGDECTALCAPGYSGVVVSVCSAGSWGAPIGACSADPCAGVPSVFVPNAAWPASCAGAASGVVCTAICSPGWAGSPLVSCNAGSWGTTVSGVACVDCVNVTLVSDEEINVCDAIDQNLDASFMYSAPNTASTMFSAYVAGVPQAECEAEPVQGAASGTLITVHCTRSSDDDRVWPQGQYAVVLTATHAGAPPCGNGSVTATALVTVAGVRLSPVKDTIPICSNSSTVANQVVAEYAYAVSATGTLTYSYNATTSPTPSTCSVVQQASSPTAGKLIVTCVGTFPTPSSVDITLNFVVRRPGATTGCIEFDDSDVVSTEFICCKPGAAFAAAPGAGNSMCFQTVDPQDVNCRARPPTTAWGFFNRGPTSVRPAIMRAGISARCASASLTDDYGSVIATCSDDDRTMYFNLTTGLFSNTSITAWYGCAAPVTPVNVAAPARTCNRFSFAFPAGLGTINANKPALAANDVQKFYSWQKNLDLPAAIHCGCNKLYWAVYQTGMFKGLTVC